MNLIQMRRSQKLIKENQSLQRKLWLLQRSTMPAPSQKLSALMLFSKLKKYQTSKGSKHWLPLTSKKDQKGNRKFCTRHITKYVKKWLWKISKQSKKQRATKRRRGFAISIIVYFKDLKREESKKMKLCRNSKGNLVFSGFPQWSNNLSKSLRIRKG
jgi:hypothetical protein